MSPNNQIVVIATRNQGKVQEFVHIFRKHHVEVSSLVDYEYMPEVVEDGETFTDNALKKAKTIALLLKVPVLADDSGLCVDALHGAPGVHSARYAGDSSNDEKNNAKLLQELSLHSAAEETLEWLFSSDQLHPRLLSTARFICSLVLYDPKQDTALQVQESCEGFIIHEPRGQNGFGYDPLFYLPQLGRTMAELSLEEKNLISHRAQALKSLMQRLDAPLNY